MVNQENIRKPLLLKFLRFFARSHRLPPPSKNYHRELHKNGLGGTLWTILSQYYIHKVYGVTSVYTNFVEERAGPCFYFYHK